VKTILWGVLALLVVGVAFLGWRYYHASIIWEGAAPEILSERLEKDADTMSVEFASRIDAPTEAVFRAFGEPERSAEFSNLVRYSKLVRSERNHKVVEFEMLILGQPQNFTLEFTFFPEERRVAVQTVENPLTDVQGEYRFTPSLDGTKTLLTYVGTAKDKVKIPLPLALQKSTLRETFVATVQALKKGLAAQQQAHRVGRGS
jgi:uncharacterized protein YndB with AHSA1/START domain